MLRNIYLTLLFVAFCGMLSAQKNKVEGLSDSTEFYNTRIENISFNSKPRVAMPEPDLTPTPRDLKYEPQEISFKPKVSQPELKVKMLDKPVWEKLQNNFVKAGFGLYLTPLLKVGVYSGRDLRKDWGAEFNHFSSFGGHVDNATFGDNAIRLKGRYIGNGNTFSAHVSFRNFSYNAFGMVRDANVFENDKQWEDHIARSYSQLNVDFGIQKQNQSTEKFFYDGIIRVNHYSDHFKNNEFFFSVLPSGKYKLSDSLWAKLNMNLTFGSMNQQGQGRGAMFAEILPQLTYRKGIINATAGLRINAVNDSVKTYLNIYPSVQAQLHLLPPYCTIYTGIDGRSMLNRRYDLADVNPWMAQQAFLRPSFERMRIFGGLKGSVEKLSYDVQISYRKVEDQWMFITADRDTAIENQKILARQFAVTYEKEFSEIAFSAQALYDIDKSLKIGAKVDYANFTLPNGQFYFHQPNLRTKVWGNYTYEKKLTVGAGINYIGKRVANLDSKGQAQYLDGFFDLNIEGSYQLSARISIFVEANNLLNQAFQRWQFYPERKLDFRAGVFVRF